MQIISMIFWAIIWWHMVRRTGGTLSWLSGIRVYVTSNLAKYIPGSIWGYVSRAYLGRDEGLTGGGVTVSVIWEVGITVVASLILTISTIPFYPTTLSPSILKAVMIVALLCFCVLLPPIANQWRKVLTHRFRSLSLQPFRWKDFWLYLFSALTTHIMVGIGFFLLVRSFVDVTWRACWSFIGMWSFSATAGLVVIVVPYGLGVKEGLLSVLLSPFLSVELSTLISLVSRIWTVIGEVIVFLIIVIVNSTLAKNTLTVMKCKRLRSHNRRAKQT
jgi:hypothetical protein